MDAIWIYIIEGVIVAAVAVLITIFAKNGWESKILGVWESMKVIWESWKERVAEKDPELAEQVSNMMQTLEDSFADGGLTIAEFETIRKSFLPLWEKLTDFISNFTANFGETTTTTTTATTATTVTTEEAKKIEE